MSEYCDICADQFSIQSRKKIKCPFDCGLNVCVSCIKRQFNESDVDIQCMSCKKPFTQEHLSTIFSKYYLKKDYKTRRGEILFNREKAQIPDTMTFVEQLKEADILSEQVKNIRKENERLKAIIEENTQNIYNITYDIYVLREGKVKENENKNKVCNIPCAVNDCRGFVDKSYKCTVCDTKICKDCHEIIININHICDENVKASVKEIKNSCKNCPKCGTSIHKIEGCDQMWCTHCHTTFSWKTGYEVSGVIHNPHYYTYIREHGGNLQRQPGDLICGGLPSIYSLRRYPVIITEFVRSINHIEAYEMNYYITNYDNRRIRANYIRKIIDKDEFINIILNREREMHKFNDIRNIFDMFRIAGTDIIQNCINNDNPKELIVQFINLIDYTNNEFVKLDKIYSLTMPYLNLEKNKYSQNIYLNTSSTRKNKHVKYKELFLEKLISNL